MRICITSFIDKKFNTYYTDSIDKKYNSIKASVQKFISIQNSNYDFTSDYINYGDALPNEIKNLKISYCIMYFNDNENGSGIILNLHKTQSVTFSELFDKSMKIWVKKGYHDPAEKSKSGKTPNFYLNYDGVVDAFSTTNVRDNDVFSTHIRVLIDDNWNYEERTEKVKKLYIKVIDKIKGIENDYAQTAILKLLNKYLNKINSSSKKTRDKYIQKFSEIFEPD
jgi:hypothetical protein